MTDLYSIIAAELQQRGYQQLEPGSAASGGGVWTHPDWNDATDGFLVAVKDCLTREADDLRSDH